MHALGHRKCQIESMQSCQWSSSGLRERGTSAQKIIIFHVSAPDHSHRRGDHFLRLASPPSCPSFSLAQCS